MTLRERIGAAIAYTETVKEGNPDVSGVWYSIKDVPLSELQAEADKQGVELYPQHNNMVLQLGKGGTTLFAHSTPVKARIVYDEDETQC